MVFFNTGFAYKRSTAGITNVTQMGMNIDDRFHESSSTANWLEKLHLAAV